MKGIRDVISRSIDQYGANSTAVQPLNVDRYKKLIAAGSYLEVAKECVRGLHQLHPVSNHNAWYHGMSDSWAFWALIIMSCSGQHGI
jgi:hypothetical protein